MSKISEFAASQKAFNERQSQAVETVTTAIGGVTADIKVLNDKITQLQNSAGGVTPEDQVLIDALQTQGAALVEKTETVATALKALDDLTPPAVV